MNRTITESEKRNFETLKRAFKAGDAALVCATKVETEEEVVLICAIHREGQEFVITPFAEMIDGNPFEMYRSPAEPQESQA